MENWRFSTCLSCRWRRRWCWGWPWGCPRVWGWAKNSWSHSTSFDAHTQSIKPGGMLNKNLSSNSWEILVWSKIKPRAPHNNDENVCCNQNREYFVTLQWCINVIWEDQTITFPTTEVTTMSEKAKVQAKSKLLHSLKNIEKFRCCYNFDLPDLSKSFPEEGK